MRKTGFRSFVCGCSIVLLSACGSTREKMDGAGSPDEYVEFHAGTLPLIFEIPHDGTKAVAGGAKRTVKTGGRDVHVSELSLETSEEIRRLTGRVPAVAILRASRTYVDANRRQAPEAWADAAGEAVWRAYDRTIAEAIGQLRKRSPAGLLVSFHSGYSFEDDVYTGVNHRAAWSTIPCFVARHGWDKFHGPDGIAGRLAARGYRVPGFGGIAPHDGWTGDVIMRHCRFNNRGVDGLQFEFSGKRQLFNTVQRKKLAADLAAVLVAFTRKYYADF